jgi:hypothetical protein
MASYLLLLALYFLHSDWHFARSLHGGRGIGGAHRSHFHLMATSCTAVRARTAACFAGMYARQGKRCTAFSATAVTPTSALVSRLSLADAPWPLAVVTVEFWSLTSGMEALLAAGRLPTIHVTELILHPA